MLVLSRKVGEEIVIAGHIRVVIVDIDRGKVRLGIVAPPDTRANRKEVEDARASIPPPLTQEPPC